MAAMHLADDLLTCCRGIPGCEFERHDNDQTLRDVNYICQVHGQTLLCRQCDAAGVLPPIDVNAALSEAGVEIVVPASVGSDSTEANIEFLAAAGAPHPSRS